METKKSINPNSFTFIIEQNMKSMDSFMILNYILFINLTINSMPSLVSSSKKKMEISLMPLMAGFLMLSRVRFKNFPLMV